ncbi:hypothetical protein CS0771_57360 [Catellatospora sp. IY07-71]|uniref:hypothetical protein n=1 Tax=Catellatospora sp. IY07-71 TaxID=2728827 RepID=UPI001BB381B9|nr:hypothetical protein [Catellatospora sp. IY07-71]BCJ76192.1 hypothetical protein CS0771_57360 [Catellatospora sp. IY07-71]
MPVVFVHGVATRKGTSYARQLGKRWSLIQNILLPTLADDPRSVGRYEAFWGDEASVLAWNGASLPRSGGEVFALADEAEDLILAETMYGDPITRAVDVSRPLLDAARRELPNATDLLWAYLSEVPDGSQGAALIDQITRMTDYAENNRRPTWLDACDDDEQLLAELLRHTQKPDTDPRGETFGGDQVIRRLRETVARIAAAPGRLIGRPFMTQLRPLVHRPSALFLGDVLEYVAQRHKDGVHGPIATIVGNKIAEAMADKSADDDRLIIIAHSMGGNIVYDLMSDLRDDLSCDLLVTVGSQVGLFAELGVFPAVSPPGDPKVDRVPKPTNIARWINVYDRQDGLSFATGGVFEGVEDFEYSTGAGPLGAHSTYFIRPSFYHRLGSRIQEGGR